MKRQATLLVFLFFLASLCVIASAPCLSAEVSAAPSNDTGQDNKNALSLQWMQIEEGMELGLSEVPESLKNGTHAVLVVLRIQPEKHRFTLFMASESGEPLSLVEWARRNELRAGINASMYLPDKLTSTGYMRSGQTVNNSNMGDRLGAFFVAGPAQATLPNADIVEKSVLDWRDLLKQYTIVAQNFRLMSQGELLWPAGGPMRSIAVVAKDREGRILFILCQEPLTVERFAQVLGSFSLHLDPVMYVEGGVQAGLFLRIDSDGTALPGATAHAVPGGTLHVWKGRQNLLNIRGNPDALLPNIIAIPANK